MDLELNRQQSALKAEARKLLGGRGDLGSARAQLDGVGDPAPLIREIAELGWHSVGIDRDDPFGLPGLCLLAAEVGYHAAPTLLVDSAVSLRLASGMTGEEAEVSCALAVLESNAGWMSDACDTQAVADGALLRVTGTKLAVHQAAACDRLAVYAMLDAEPAVVLLSPHAEGCAITASPGLDPSAGACVVTFDRTPVDSVLTRDPTVLARAFAIGAVATAAEALGAATRALEMAVDYAKERQQFGRSIGSNQALQHLLADMLVRRETSWSTVLYASAALEEDLEDGPLAASVAKAYACRSAREIVEGALQVFGGIGFTWLHDAHLLQRRVLECERRFGDGIDHERLLAAQLDSAVGAGRN